MKPFDLEKAKNGAAVCVADGTPVKILDFDFNGNILFKYVENAEDPPRQFTFKSGNFILGISDQNGIPVNQLPKEYELRMAPRIAYMNVWKEDGPTLVGDVICVTKEECKKCFGPKDENRFFCIAKVELLED